MSQELRLALLGGMVPGLLTGVTLLLLWWRHTKKSVATGADNSPESAALGPVWAAPIVLIIGYGLAVSATNGWPTLWPDNNTYRFPHAAALLGAMGLLEALWGSQSLMRQVSVSVIRAAALAGGVWMLAEGYHDAGSVDDATFYGVMLVTALGGAWVMQLADHGAAPRHSGASACTVGLLLALLGAACIPLLFGAGSALAAQSSAGLVAFAVAASLAGWIVGWLTRKYEGGPGQIRLDRGGVSTFAGLVIVQAAAVNFQVYPEPKGAAGLLLLGLAPIGLCVLAAPRVSQGTPAGVSKLRMLAAMGVVLLTLGAAGAVVGLAQPAAEEGPDDGSYEYYP